MGVVIANQRIEDDVVEQSQYVGRTRSRDSPYRFKALCEIWAAFVLVFHLRHHTECLAEIFLV